MFYYEIDSATRALKIAAFIILHVFISIKICRGLYYLRMFNQQNSNRDKLYIYPFCLKNDLKNTVLNIQSLLFLVWLFLFFYFDKNLREILIAIFFIILVCHLSTYPLQNHVLETNNLHVGYGAALAYYKNYLELTLTERFSERIDKFSSENMVPIRKKLFILVPQSCKVHCYLDSIEHENIERCRELPDEEISHGGIKKRKYNITIYNINGLRMAVEFAQPLKALHLFKEKGIFTVNEMLYERELFAQTLKNFLHEDPYKYFEIVEYNDSVQKIDDVLTKSYHGLLKSYSDSETV